MQPEISQHRPACRDLQPVALESQASYTPPRLTALGAWQAVTLIVSVPLGPGGKGLGLGSPPQY